MSTFPQVLNLILASLSGRHVVIWEEMIQGYDDFVNIVFRRRQGQEGWDEL